MDSKETDSTFHIDISDLEEIEKKEKERKATNEYQRKYNKRPEVKSRKNKLKQTENLTKALKKLGTHDPHEMCKKLGQTMAHSRRNPDYFYRCSTCGVSYSDKEKIHFYKGNNCPCCHRKLRMRKTIREKRNISIENYRV